MSEDFDEFMILHVADGLAAAMEYSIHGDGGAAKLREGKTIHSYSFCERKVVVDAVVKARPDDGVKKGWGCIVDLISPIRYAVRKVYHREVGVFEKKDIHANFPGVGPVTVDIVARSTDGDTREIVAAFEKESPGE